MRLVEWFRSIIKPATSQPYVADSTRLADDIKRTGDEIGKKLASYSTKSDPLVAIFSDLYEAHQESNIWRSDS